MKALLSRCAVTVFGLAAISSSSAQPARELPPASDDEVVALPEFSVSAASDDGWVASGSLSGTRTNVPLQNLPRSIQVLTSEFLADIGADTLSDAAAFMTGVTSQGKQDAVFDNNTFTVRGMRQNRHYRDGVKEGFVGMINDTVTIDRIESLRGPSSLLAGVVEPGGMINQISKRPRAKNETSVKLAAGSWDYFRAEFDTSVIASKRLALRAAAAYQTNDSWRPWEGSERKVAYLAGALRLAPRTILNARAESIRYEGVVSVAVPNMRIPTSASPTSATAAPAVGAYAFGYVPEEIVPGISIHLVRTISGRRKSIGSPATFSTSSTTPSRSESQPTGPRATAATCGCPATPAPSLRDSPIPRWAMFRAMSCQRKYAGRQRRMTRRGTSGRTRPISGAASGIGASATKPSWESSELNRATGATAPTHRIQPAPRSAPRHHPIRMP